MLLHTPHPIAEWVGSPYVAHTTWHILSLSGFFILLSKGGVAGDRTQGLGLPAPMGVEYMLCHPVEPSL